MEKETFIFDRIRKEIQAEYSLQEKLDYIANRVKDIFGVNIWFVQIFGKRWSYFAGRGENDSFLSPARFRLNGQYGMCLENIKKFPPAVEKSLINLLQDVIKNESK